MIKALRQFFQQLSPDQQQASEPPSVEVATAALLFEVMRADDEFDASEQIEVRSLLKKQFSINDEQVEQMIKDAEQEAFDATDYHQFTRLLCEHYDLEQRKGIVEQLWQVAYADGEISPDEEHLIRRLSDLLRIRHSEFIQCKLKVIDK